MEIKNILILLSAALLIITSAAHSFFGEKMLIAPLLKDRHGVMNNDLARVILRFAWHITSIAWLVLASILITFVVKPDQVRSWTLLAVGVSFSAVGIYDAFVSRGRHLGWPWLTAVGISSLAALPFA